MYMYVYIYVCTHPAGWFSCVVNICVCIHYVCIVCMCCTQCVYVRIFTHTCVCVHKTYIYIKKFSCSLPTCLPPSLSRASPATTPFGVSFLPYTRPLCPSPTPFLVCVCVCIYIYMRVCVKYIHINIYICVCTNVYAHTYAFLPQSLHTYTRAHTHIDQVTVCFSTHTHPSSDSVFLHTHTHPSSDSVFLHTHTPIK